MKIREDLAQVLNAVRVSGGSDQIEVIEIPGLPIDSEDAFQDLTEWLSENDNKAKLVRS